MRHMRDISNDLLLVQNDFLGSVVLKIAGTSDITLRDSVLSEPVEWRELAPSGGRVIRRGSLFVWPKKLSPTPVIGSIIVSEGVYYTVWTVTDKQHVETWECRALNLNITNAPWNRALLLKATYVKGEANEAKAVWKGLWSESTEPTDADVVRACFQPSEETAQIEFGGEFAKETYRVYLDKPIPPELAGGEYRLVDAGGFRYRVTRYENEQRIDRLPVAIAIRIVEGAEYWQTGTPPAMTP